MSYECILWNYGDGHDKLWGVTSYQNQYASFWGRRGNQLTFKKLPADEDIYKLIETKKRKRGYRETSFNELEGLDPDFRAEFDHMLIMCIMGNSFHKKKEETDG